MLPIAAEISDWLTQEHARSALPDAPTTADKRYPPRRRVLTAGSQRLLSTVLRRLADSTWRFADRIDRPVGAR